MSSTGEYRRQGYIDRSPVAHLKKPRCDKKEIVVTDEHYRAMLAATRDDAFKDLLIVSWETGCRPQESLRVQAQHVQLDHQRWVIPTTPGKPDTAGRRTDQRTLCDTGS